MTERIFTTSDFNFALPAELIAQHPAPERSSARLLDGGGEQPLDRIFRDLPTLLSPDDLLVFNDTQVVKARLFGAKPTGGRLELLIERVLQGGTVAAHMKVSKKPPVGTVLRMDGGFAATLLGRWPNAEGALFHLRLSGDAYAIMAAHGHVPLPPYITHADSDEDVARYQTVFAKNPGAVAAPTAALHFDETVLAALNARGVQRAAVTLHVGAGTFQPVKTESIAEHVMHHERYHVPQATQAAIAACRARGEGAQEGQREDKGGTQQPRQAHDRLSCAEGRERLSRGRALAGQQPPGPGSVARLSRDPYSWRAKRRWVSMLVGAGSVRSYCTMMPVPRS